MEAEQDLGVCEDRVIAPDGYDMSQVSRIVFDPYPSLRTSTNYVYHGCKVGSGISFMGIEENISEYRHGSSDGFSIFRAGSRFKGYQRSESVQYEVSVEILSIDLRGGLLYGQLTILELIKEFPSLTTFFSGEIIGSNHSFLSNFDGSSLESDITYWSLFREFEPLKKLFIKNPNIPSQLLRIGKPLVGMCGLLEESESEDCFFDTMDEVKEKDEILVFHDSKNGTTPMTEEESQILKSSCSEQAGSRFRDVIFMRWKEKFLIPNHRLNNIQGASYDGFYYICMDVNKRVINGVYHQTQKDRSRTSLSEELHLKYDTSSRANNTYQEFTIH